MSPLPADFKQIRQLADDIIIGNVWNGFLKSAGWRSDIMPWA